MSLLGRFRRMRLRSLTEDECYARSYGSGDDNVKVVKLPPRRPRFPSRMSGEELRRLFEARLRAREEEEESERV